MAEQLAENYHNTWGRKKKQELEAKGEQPSPTTPTHGAPQVGAPSDPKKTLLSRVGSPCAQCPSWAPRLGPSNGGRSVGSVPSGPPVGPQWIPNGSAPISAPPCAPNVFCPFGRHIWDPPMEDAPWTPSPTVPQRFPNGSPTVPQWFLNGSPVDPQWFPNGSPTVPQWIPNSSPIVPQWFPQWFPQRIPDGSPTDLPP